MSEGTQITGTGRFITIEGFEGAGKTHVAGRLADELAARGLSVVSTREPGGTTLGEGVRRLLLDPRPGEPPLGPWTDALLFNAARAQLMAEVVEPALARGDVVVCARFADSTLAYQGFGAGLPLAELLTLEAIATGGRKPDLTVLLDVPVEIGLGRKGADEQTRFESDLDREFQERVRAGFLALAAAEPQRFAVVDARLPADEVFAAVLGIVLAHLGTVGDVRAEPASFPLRIP